MTATAETPIPSDYRKQTFSAGEADLVWDTIVIGDYVYCGTDTVPAKIIKVRRDDFSNRTVKTFASDGAHDRIRAMIYSPDENKFYALFGTDPMTVSEIDPDDLTHTDVISEAGSETAFPPSLAVNTTHLFVLFIVSGETLKLKSYAFSDWGADEFVDSMGSRGSAIAIHDGKLYFPCWLAETPTQMVMMKVDAAAMTLDSTTPFPSGVHTLPMPRFAEVVTAGGFLWTSFHDIKGSLYRFSLPDMAVEAVSTGLTGDHVGLEYGGTSIWHLLEDGHQEISEAMAVRYNPVTKAALYYSLPLPGYLHAITGATHSPDGEYLYGTTYETPTTLVRYGFATSPAGSTVWAFTRGSIGQDQAQSVCADHLGNVFYCGAIGPQIMLSKLSPAGALQWEGLYSSGGIGYGVAVDSTGNIYMIGDYSGPSATFGSGPPLPTAPNQGIFVVKFDTNGTMIWQKGFVSTGGNANGGRGIAIRDTGIYITGMFEGTISFGGDSLVTAGGTDIFAARISTVDGSHVWSKRYGSIHAGSNEVGLSIDADSSGNVFAGGVFIGPLDFGDGTPIGILNPEGYLLKLSAANGSLTWARAAISSSGLDFVNGVAATGDGGCVMIGVRSGILQGTGTVVIIRYNSAGGITWSKTVISEAPSLGKSIAVDSAGNIYAAGRAVGNVDFGDGVTVYGAGDAFAAKLDASGRAIWAKVWGDIYTDSANWVSASGGNIYLAGFWYGSVDFGDGITRTSTPIGDTFVLKLLP